MSSYKIGESKAKRVIRTLDAVSINYDGKMTDKIYAVTITSRKKYNNLYHFREDLYSFLSKIGYDHAVKGFMEFHSKGKTMDKVHAHCVVFNGNPPKDNTKNRFHFKINKITDSDAWLGYCKKDILETLERQHDIVTGMINYRKKPVCLFDD